MTQTNFEVPEDMADKRTNNQKHIFLKACADNRNMKEFMLGDRKLNISDEDFKTLIHNTVFNTVYLLKY